MNLESRYAQLCQELGHLYNNLQKIKQRMAAIEAEVAALDSIKAAQKAENQNIAAKMRKSKI